MTDTTAPGISTEPEIVLDPVEMRKARIARNEKIGRWVLPFVVVVLTILGWELFCVINEVPHYIIPRPGIVLEALMSDWSLLMSSLGATLVITFSALTIAIIGGVGLAILFAQSKWVEMSFFPYAVILQVTPIIVVAPLIFIYVDSKFLGLLICAWIVAFFPILSNTTLGLKSADHNLVDMMKLYGATRWQTLRFLRLPSALPYFLGGLKIAGGLSLIGAIVAEFVAGAGGAGSGLAFRILEASYRLNIPRMFAAILLISFTGILIFMLMSFLSWLFLHKWHESAIKRES
jgi:NitT/TauT family transport system permease protein